MKHVRKIFAFALTLVMAFAVALPAFAQTDGTAADGKGSITVNNAAKGETYEVVKIFGATLSDDNDNKGIAYTGDIPSALKDYFEKDSTGNIIRKSSATDDGALLAAVQAYAKDQQATRSVESDGSSLTFEGLDYGYYFVKSSQGTAVTINSTKPNASIYDKNTKTVSVTKDVGKQSYSIGDRINYIVTFNAPNYLSPENAASDGSDARQVVEYVISDTLPEFLSDVQVDSIKIMDPSTEPDTVLATVTDQFDNKSLTITWADAQETSPKTYQSKYKNGAQIVIEYHGTLTATTNINATDENEVTITAKTVKPDGTTTNPEPWSETWSDSAEITTYGAALKKTDGTNSLKGAKFAVKGLTVAAVGGEAGVYKVVNYNPQATDLGTEMSTNNDGKLYIIGLASDASLQATETKAPDGYNKLEDTVTITPHDLSKEVYETTGTRKYDAYGNLVSESSQGTTSKTVEKNYTELDGTAVEVVNQKGTALPSTGGIGTTIFYVVGGVMVAGAAIFLLTKRRAAASE